MADLPQKDGTAVCKQNTLQQTVSTVLLAVYCKKRVLFCFVLFLTFYDKSIKI